MVEDKKWFNYVIFDRVKTYVGSTVNLDRRIRQHNGIIKGGAKYTRGGNWQYYCVIFNLYGEKRKCLSEEWHIKWESGKVKGAKNTYNRRQLALQKYIPKDPFEYKYVFFLSSKFKQYLPMFNSSVFVYIIDDFKESNILHHLQMFKNFIESQNYADHVMERLLAIVKLRTKNLIYNI